jgi:hypothetical protein
MIPYDDLVIALATWRARQGLPVAQLSGALTPPPPAPSASQSNDRLRTAPPPPPRNVAPPPPLEEPVHDEVDAAALIDEGVYENEGADFAMAFGSVQQEAESTAIGMPPTANRDSFGGGGTQPDEPPPPPGRRGGKRKKDDW